MQDGLLLGGYRRGGREAIRKRRNAALDADRLSAYEAGSRVEGRSVNRLLLRFCAGRAFTRRVRSYFVRLQLGVQPRGRGQRVLGVDDTWNRLWAGFWLGLLYCYRIVWWF
jgi:hypothetical protein